ncbi:MAG: 4-alpha-glucanotransferase [Desertifilum sp.]|nr:4-alpha-glucanotransferase [Desertifilum sp.]
MALKRGSGILLHPTSLPGRFGIGDLGQSAYEFVDFLVKSGQTYWQVLPLGPIGYYHSPYTMNYSAFAGNPLLISLEQLVEQGLLQQTELTPVSEKATVYGEVDYDRVIPLKQKLLERACDRFWQDSTVQPHFAAFCQQQAWWLDEYTLFMALLEENPERSWNQWEPALARRQPEALKAKAETLKDRIRFHQFVQYQFFEQWKALRTYANNRHIQIIGDVSIYVCYNSADVWANATHFALDPQTLEVAWQAGVPPDYFSETGQLWGNPVYNWEHLQKTQYAWWIKRFQATLQYVDIVRIDHFRAFEAYWRIPQAETTALAGEWVKVPGVEFFQTLGEKLGQLPVLAEDLGTITPEVEDLRDRFEFPGMRILLFAFGEAGTEAYLPHRYRHNSVVYPGTHDNDTVMGWWQQKATEAEKQHVAAYIGKSHYREITEIHWELIRLALASVADIAIIPLQDLWGLDNRARMNDPSQSEGNWEWRFTDTQLLTEDLSDRIRQLTQLYSR